MGGLRLLFAAIGCDICFPLINLCFEFGREYLVVLDFLVDGVHVFVEVLQFLVGDLALLSLICHECAELILQLRLQLLYVIAFDEGAACTPELHPSPLLLVLLFLLLNCILHQLARLHEDRALTSVP